jgi:uncharacterized protein
MHTILITGGTGIIGKALTKALLEKDYNIIILTRHPEKQTSYAPKISYAGWNISNQTIDKESITTSDYIIHLAGAGIADKRWTKKRKQEIVDSRVKSGELLIKALKENSNNIKAVISASGIGWYLTPNPSPQGGEGKGLRKFEESDPPANDFLGQTCKQWEESLEPITQLNKRLVKLRTGIVLSNEGGALPRFIKPLRFGIAPILSNGKQIMSWIHIDDLVRIYIAAIENENMSGTYNAVAPGPVSNKELVLQLAKRKRGRFFIPLHVPSFVLKLILGEMSIEVLKSATVSCDKVHFAGFTFLYPSLKAALEQLTHF